MGKLLYRGTALIAFIAGTASAADLPIGVPVYNPPIMPLFSWSGFYSGLNLGGHFGGDKITTTTDAAGGFGPAGASAVDSGSPGKVSPAGLMFGAQAGYNWQFGNAVVGIEADANGLFGNSNRTVGAIPVVAPGDFLTDSTKQPSFLLTVRPRLGWAFDRTLLYVTGGYAFGTIQVIDTFGYFGGTVALSSDVTGKRSGWTAGAGAEYAFTKNVSAKIEYLYVDLGSFDSPIVGPPVAAPDNVNIHHKYTDNIVRAGVNFHW